MAISNMQQSRQLRAEGGIMNLQPRQGYFLGKLVRKITRPVKKILKSPLGKAALMAGGAYYLGGGNLLGMQRAGATGFGMGDFMGKGAANFLRSGASNLFKAPGSDGKGIGSFLGRGVDKFNNLSFGKKALLGLGAGAVALPFLGGEEEEEIISDPFSSTPGSITDIVSMAQNRDPSLRFLPQNRYVQKNFYKAADGGIARLANGGGAGQEQMMQALQAEYMKYKQQGGTMPFEQFAKLVMQQQQGGQQTQMAANGGRIGYAEAGPVMQEDVEVIDKDQVEVASNNENDRILESLFEKYLGMGMSSQEAEAAARMEFDKMSQAPAMQEQETIVEDRVMANAGGMIDYMSSANPMAKSYLMEDTDIVNMYRPGDNRQMAAEGGIMDLGGMEKDYRAEGGFVPIGGREKADDVPARLSKNEFVFTADAVRNAGGGDIDQGAAVMERMMDHLEQGGQVSEESQGGNPAQEMFDTSQQLESRIA